VKWLNFLSQNPPNNDTPSGINIKKQAGGFIMKQPPLKLINITKKNDKPTLQTQITEKISKIITREYNNT
jgi:hypothetical protein